MKELNFDWLLNGSCLLSDVAMAYFTTCVYPRSAGKRMRDEIERYPNLYAELLEAAGVDTVKELAHRVPKNLAEKMAEVNAAKNLTNGAVSEKEVAKWVEEAKTLPAVMTY